MPSIQKKKTEEKRSETLYPQSKRLNTPYTPVSLYKFVSLHCMHFQGNTYPRTPNFQLFCTFYSSSVNLSSKILIKSFISFVFPRAINSSTADFASVLLNKTLYRALVIGMETWYFSAS